MISDESSAYLNKLTGELVLLTDEQLSALKIKGSGAFERFKRAIYSMGIEKDWYRFRDAEYERVAAEWLEKNGIAYSLDLSEDGRRTEQAAAADSQ